MTREEFNTIKEQLPKFVGRETKFRTANRYTGKEDVYTGVIVQPNGGILADHIILAHAGKTVSIHFSRIDFPDTIQA